MDPSSPSLVRRGLLTAGMILLSILVVVLVLDQTDIGAAEVADLWARASPAYLSAALVVMTGGMVFLAFRWRSLMTEPEKVQVLPTTVILVIGTMLNFVVPGPVGEFAAAAMAGRRFGIAPEMAFAASVHARFLGLTVAGVLAALAFLLGDVPVPPEIHTMALVASVAMGVGGLGLLGLSMYPEVLSRISELTLARLPLLRRLHPMVMRLASALASIGRLGPARYLKAGLWAMTGHICVISGIGLAAVGLGASPNVGGLVFTYAMATAGAVALIAFPGGQIAWDALFCSLLVGSAGVTLPDAVGVTLVARVQQTLLIALGALALSFHDWRDGRSASTG